MVESLLGLLELSTFRHVEYLPATVSPYMECLLHKTYLVKES